MTTSDGSSARRPDDSTSRRGFPWGPVAFVVVLALAGLIVWRIVLGGLIAGLRAPDGPATSEATTPRPEGSKSYLPATHVDVTRAKLSPGPDGNARVELVLRDVGDTAGLVAKLRKGADPKSPTLFIDTKTDATGIGLLGIRFTETGSPGESALAIDLGIPATHVTVIDLRFGGRWEGLELDASAPAPK